MPENTLAVWLLDRGRAPLVHAGDVVEDVLLTKDNWIRYRAAELEALQEGHSTSRISARIG